MTASEIYSKLIRHTVRGLMVHSQLMEYYSFLNLCGYSKCHEYHYLTESATLMRIVAYHSQHHNSLIPTLAVEDPHIIPSSWYKYTRFDVDSSTRKGAVKDGIARWRDWELDTKELYENSYMELVKLGEIASANFIRDLLDDVDKELCEADKEHLKLKGIDYDLTTVTAIQDELYDKYYALMRQIGK